MLVPSTISCTCSVTVYILAANQHCNVTGKIVKHMALFLYLSNKCHMEVLKPTQT